MHSDKNNFNLLLPVNGRGLIFTALLTIMTFSIQAKEPTHIKELDWRIINDSVMGGVSRSQFNIFEEYIRFSGHVSLENNGGFASIRTLHAMPTVDKTKIVIKVRGDGQTYQFRVRIDRYFDGPAFVTTFKTEQDKWQEFQFSPQDFELQYRGRKFESRYQLNFKDITTIGFLISNKQSGDFVLDIADIEFNQ